MKYYDSLDQLRKHWFTMKDLSKYLESRGYPYSNSTLYKWREKGIMPQDTFVMFRGTKWRVFSKDGKDFQNIVDNLNKHGDVIDRMRSVLRRPAYKLP